MLRILKILHNVLITVFLALVYPNFAFVSLIAMAIGYKAFGSVAEWHRTWVDTVKDVWRCKT